MMAQEAVVLGQAVQACQLTYAEWYHAQFATTTLPETTRALSVSLATLVTSFGLCWNLNVVTDDFKLNKTQV